MLLFFESLLVLFIGIFQLIVEEPNHSKSIVKNWCNDNQLDARIYNS